MFHNLSNTCSDDDTVNTSRNDILYYLFAVVFLSLSILLKLLGVLQHNMKLLIRLLGVKWAPVNSDLGFLTNFD